MALANALSNSTGLDIDPRIITTLFPGFWGYGTPFSEAESVYSLLYGSGTNASLPDDAMVLDLRNRGWTRIPPSLSGYKNNHTWSWFQVTASNKHTLWRVQLHLTNQENINTPDACTHPSN